RTCPHRSRCAPCPPRRGPRGRFPRESKSGFDGVASWAALSARRRGPYVTVLTGAAILAQPLGADAMELPLSGRVALVTGPTRAAGIGSAIARALARDGASVLVHVFRPYDRAQPWGVSEDEPERLASELSAHADVDCVECDLKDPDAAPALIERALRRFG